MAQKADISVAGPSPHENGVRADPAGPFSIE